MNKNADGTKKKITIDGESIDKLDLGNVALMANSEVRIGDCSQIYGDVLARERIEVAVGGCTSSNPNVIIGNITTQHHNDNLLTTFGDGTHLVVPKSNGSGGANSGTTTGLTADNLKLKWTKVL